MKVRGQLNITGGSANTNSLVVDNDSLIVSSGGTISSTYPDSYTLSSYGATGTTFELIDGSNQKLYQLLAYGQHRLLGVNNTGQLASETDPQLVLGGIGQNYSIRLGATNTKTGIRGSVSNLTLQVTDNSGAESIRLYKDNAQGIDIFPNDSTNYIKFLPTHRGIKYYTGISNVAGGGHIFYTKNPTQSTDLERFYIQTRVDNAISYFTNTAGVGINKTSPAGMLHIVGAGSTSGTTSMLVENSSNVDALNVKDDTSVIIGTYSGLKNSLTQLLINGNSGNGATNSKGLHIKHSINGGIGTTYSLFIEATANPAGSVYPTTARIVHMLGGTFYTGGISIPALTSNLNTYTAIGTDVEDLVQLKVNHAQSNYASVGSNTVTGKFVNAVSRTFAAVTERKKTSVLIQSTGVWNNTTTSGATNIGLDVQVSDGDVNYAALFNGGNVGIGTTTPSATLDLVGTLQYVDGNQASGYVLTSDASGNATWQAAGADANFYTTGATLTGGTTLVFDRTDTLNAYNVDLSSLKFTGNTSGTCISDLYVSNIHSCSPLFINPLNEGNVYIGSSSGFTYDVTNNRLGINKSTPIATLHVKSQFSTSATKVIKTENNGAAETFSVTDDGRVNAKDSYWINSNKILSATGATLNSFLWNSTVFPNTPSGTRNTLIGNNDTGTITITTGSFNFLAGSFTSVNLASGNRNILIGTYSTPNLISGNYNIFLGNSNTTLTSINQSIAFNGEVRATSQVVFGDPDRARYNDFYFGQGIDTPDSYGKFNVNFNVTSNQTGEINKNATVTNFNINGGVGTGTGEGSDINFKVSPPTVSGSTPNPLVTAITIKNSGNVGIGTTTPSATLDLVGTFQYVDGNQASGYVLTSDSGGTATWQAAPGSSAPGKYSITTGFTASVGKTITHNLGTEDVIVNLWDSNVQTDGQVEVVDSNNITVTMSSSATFKVVVVG